MPVNVQTQMAIARRRARVSILILRGTRNLAQLQATMRREGWRETSIGTLSGDVAALEEEWRTTYATVIEVDKARMVAELDLMKQELWDAWDRSRSTRKRRRKKAHEEPTSGKGRKAGLALVHQDSEASEEDRDGDPRYMALILEIDKFIAQLKRMVPKEKMMPDGLVKLKAKVKHELKQETNVNVNVLATDSLAPYMAAIESFFAQLRSGGEALENGVPQPVDPGGAQAATPQTDVVPPP